MEHIREIPPAGGQRLDIVSDLHLNFWKDFGRRWILDLRPGSDILIIAGDMGDHQWFRVTPKLLPLLCEKYEHVLFVAGNHDYYGTSIEEGIERFRGLEERIHSFHFMDMDTITIDGTTFAGTTMWFRDGVYNTLHQKYMNDFHVIKDFAANVYTENTLALDFLSRLTDVDVVITHHLPSSNSVANIYTDDALTKFFLCEVEDVICSVDPKLWVHGHTHHKCDYMFSDTRVVCNPRGYRGEYYGEGQRPEDYTPLTVEI